MEDYKVAPNQPLVSGVYEVLLDHEEEHYRSDGLIAGNLVHVVVGQAKLHVIINDTMWTYDYDNDNDMDEFRRMFRYLPDGEQRWQQKVTGVMQDISAVEHNYQQATKQLTGFAPHVVGDEIATSTALASTKTTSIQLVKRTVAEMRNDIARVQKNIKAKTTELTALLEQQQKSLEIKAKELDALVKKAEEAIWTINLYLGRNEEIHVLRKGKAAPPEMKISIRQKLLYMDEECGKLAGRGGIDITSADEFDKWIVADPKNLQQVLPEEKGIVALHVRRYKKEYGDPFVSAEMNKANQRWTYILIRNGERLYRVKIDLILGSRILPGRDEFEDVFATTETDWDAPGHPSVRKVHKPGTREYMKALDQAAEIKQHYLRVVLVLQGLLDRTPIFKPLPADQINICDPRTCEEYINFIYDDEAHTALTDGRPMFDKWQRELNDKLEIGMRIIGNFGYSADLYGYKSQERRVVPRTANSPDNDRLYTIERRDDDRYVFLYERTGETIYPRNYYEDAHEPKVRASCYVYKKDKFFLAFDATTVEELEYYRVNRLSRHLYDEMLPVVEVAIKLKHKEAKQEAPFRQLLVGELMKQYGVSLEDAEKSLDELIRWWKFKNRTHRALTSDDEKALRMIVTEFGLRNKQAAVREKIEQMRRTIVQVILAQTPAPVLIAHKADNKYVAYVPHNDNNIWVTEQTWTHNRTTGSVYLSNSKAWKLVDKRHERWHIIYQHERWANWTINPIAGNVLTDPEIVSLVDKAMTMLPDKELLNYGYYDRALSKKHKRFLPLNVYCDIDFDIHIWYSDVGPIIPTKNLISNAIEFPRVAHATIKWERKKDGLTISSCERCHHDYTAGMKRPPFWEKRDERPPWIVTYHGDIIQRNVIRDWPENFATFCAECKQVKETLDKQKRLNNLYDYVIEMVTESIYAARVGKARREYDSEHGAPDLWEDHLQSLKLKTDWNHRPLGTALGLCAERHISLVGKTLEFVFSEAKKAQKNYKKENQADLDDLDPEMPLDFVIPPAPPKEPDEESDVD